jgi:hypothetical protein
MQAQFPLQLRKSSEFFPRPLLAAHCALTPTLEPPAQPWPLPIHPQQPYFRCVFISYTLAPPNPPPLYFSLERDLNNLDPLSIPLLSSISFLPFSFPLTVEAQSAVQTASRLQELQVRQSCYQRSRQPLGNQKDPHTSRSDSYSQVRTAFYFYSPLFRAHCSEPIVPSPSTLCYDYPVAMKKICRPSCLDLQISSTRGRGDIPNWEREGKQHLKHTTTSPFSAKVLHIWWCSADSAAASLSRPLLSEACIR